MDVFEVIVWMSIILMILHDTVLHNILQFIFKFVQGMSWFVYVSKVATCYFRFTCLQSHNATDMVNVAGLRMSERRKFSVCTWQWNCVFWYVYQYLLSNIKQFTLYKI